MWLKGGGGDVDDHSEEKEDVENIRSWANGGMGNVQAVGDETRSLNR